MGAGFTGTYVLSWSQAELDGLPNPPLSALRIGATWSWRGKAVRMDGPDEVLRLEQAEQDRNLRKRAAKVVRRLAGAGRTLPPSDPEIDGDDPLVDGAIVLTDGRSSLTATIVQMAGAAPLLMFNDELPVPGRDYWIVQLHNIAATLAPAEPPAAGVVCFTPGTRIATPYGAVPVEDLREGDRVLTRDNGPSEILWTGSRRLTGARLFAQPQLRPVRIRAGALGIERPDHALLVSPDHRMLIKGRAAQALFNTPEVLVTARDLINGGSIRQEMHCRDVTYIHLLLDSHQVIWANKVESESFHPASASLPALTEEDRARLLSGLPEAATDPMAYGDYARRILTKPEAAILMHGG